MESGKIKNGDFFGELMLERGISNNTLQGILEASKEIFDIRMIKVGNGYEFYYRSGAKDTLSEEENGNNVPECARSVPEVCQGVPERLIDIIKINPSISRDELSKQLNISVRQVRKIIDQLRRDGVLTREGGDAGRWIIHTKNIN